MTIPCRSVAADHDSLAVKGFTLLEVMIAVAIIGITLVTLIGAQSQSIDIAGVARFEVDAALLAQEKLAELSLEAASPDSQLVSENGDFGDEYPAFAWSTEVNSLTESDVGFDPEDSLVSVDLTVFLVNDETTSFIVRQLFYVGN